MDATAPVLFSLTPAVVYATTAVVITTIAMVIGYIYIRKTACMSTKLENKQMTDAHITKPPITTNTSIRAMTEESTVLSGTWPTNNDGQGKLSGQDRDPVEFCNHLQSEVKRTQQKVAIKKIEEEMTVEQKESEHDIQRDQLESIFKLMHKQEDKFGVDSIEDIQSQMKLYM